LRVKQWNAMHSIPVELWRSSCWHWIDEWFQTVGNASHHIAVVNLMFESSMRNRQWIFGFDENERMRRTFRSLKKWGREVHFYMLYDSYSIMSCAHSHTRKEHHIKVVNKSSLSFSFLFDFLHSDVWHVLKSIAS